MKIKTLTEIRKQHPDHQIPDLPFYPTGKRVSVWRLPRKDVERTAGGIIIPDISKDEAPQSWGILLAAGCAALDVLEYAGYEMGDTVAFGKFAGEDRTVNDAELARLSPKDRPAQILTLNVSDLLGSKQLVERIAKGEVEFVLVENDHFIRHKGQTDHRPMVPRQRHDGSK
jgi:co-chaperonin GroES (HSP10)